MSIKCSNKEISAITGTGKKERILEGRVYLWSSLINEWKEQSALQKTFGTGKMAIGAHNDYIMMLHGGVVGLLILPFPVDFHRDSNPLQSV